MPAAPQGPQRLPPGLRGIGGGRRQRQRCGPLIGVLAVAQYARGGVAGDGRRSQGLLCLGRHQEARRQRRCGRRTPRERLATPEPWVGGPVVGRRAWSSLECATRPPRGAVSGFMTRRAWAAAGPQLHRRRPLRPRRQWNLTPQPARPSQADAWLQINTSSQRGRVLGSAQMLQRHRRQCGTKNHTEGGR